MSSAGESFRRRLLIFSLLLFPATASALQIADSKPFSLNLKGYYKNLFFTSKGMATGNWYVADINRARTEWRLKFFKIVSADIFWDNEIIGGDYLQTQEFNLRQAVRNDPYLDQDFELSRQNNFFYGQALYRASLRIDPGPFTLTLGRQKIDWGSARLLSPGDLFTPLTILDIEKEEKTGSDAVNLLVPTGEKTRFNLIYTLHEDFDQSRTALRATHTIAHFDVSLYGGRFQRDVIFGTDYSGDIGDAGLRGEVNYNVSDAGKDFVQGSVGVDYGFKNTLTLAGEYFFNGQAANQRNAALLATTTTAQPVKTQYQHFLIAQAGYDFTPLWTGKFLALWDMRGSSIFINPETAYSVFSWWELTLGAIVPVGRSQGEFTAVPNIYYLQSQLFF